MFFTSHSFKVLTNQGTLNNTHLLRDGVAEQDKAQAQQTLGHGTFSPVFQPFKPDLCWVDVTF